MLIILVLFGGKKIPQLAKSLGVAIREVRGGFRDEPPQPDAKPTTKDPQSGHKD